MTPRLASATELVGSMSRTALYLPAAVSKSFNASAARPSLSSLRTSGVAGAVASVFSFSWFFGVASAGFTVSFFGAGGGVLFTDAGDFVGVLVCGFGGSATTVSFVGSAFFGAVSVATNLPRPDSSIEGGGGTGCGVGCGWGSSSLGGSGDLATGCVRGRGRQPRSSGLFVLSSFSPLLVESEALRSAMIRNSAFSFRNWRMISSSLSLPALADDVLVRTTQFRAVRLRFVEGLLGGPQLEPRLLEFLFRLLQFAAGLGEFRPQLFQVRCRGGRGRRGN